MGSTGIELSERLKQLESALREYLGALNEVKMGLAVKQMPKKPNVLAIYERCQSLNLPLVDGGIMNQPHIWLQEVAVITEVKALFDELERRRIEQERLSVAP